MSTDENLQAEQQDNVDAAISFEAMGDFFWDFMNDPVEAQIEAEIRAQIAAQ